MIVRNANFSGHTRRQTLCLVAASDQQPTNNGKLHGGGLLPPFTFNHTNRSLSPLENVALRHNKSGTCTSTHYAKPGIFANFPRASTGTQGITFADVAAAASKRRRRLTRKTRFTNHFPTTVSSSYGNYPHLGARASPANTHPKIRAFACAELTGLQRQRMSCVATTLQTREHFRKRDAKRVPRGLEKLLRFLA